MDKYIFYADRLVSVATPYLDDDFVKSHHRMVAQEEVPPLLETYRSISENNRLLTGILGAISQINQSTEICIVDVGVFMGSFTIGVALAGKQQGFNLEINAYEANPLLIPAIINNLQLYDIKAKLHWGGVGIKRGSQEFVVTEGGAIGGSLANINERKYGNFFCCTIDVLPLSEILADKNEIELVKIDIEGHEVSAFSSIAAIPNMVNNIFIIEFAPVQAEERMPSGMTYGQFLLEFYNVFNIGNWGWYSKAEPITNQSSLTSCDLGNGGHNTDLLLIPKIVTINPSCF